MGPCSSVIGINTLQSHCKPETYHLLPTKRNDKDSGSIPQHLDLSGIGIPSLQYHISTIYLPFMCNDPKNAVSTDAFVSFEETHRKNNEKKNATVTSTSCNCSSESPSLVSTMGIKRPPIFGFTGRIRKVESWMSVVFEL